MIEQSSAEQTVTRSRSDDPRGLRRWSGNRRPTSLGSRGFRVSTRVTGHEKRPKESPARQVRPSSTPPGDLWRHPASTTDSNSLRALRRGARRAARVDRTAPLLLLVSKSHAAATPPLELRRAVERHVPVRGLSRHCRSHDGFRSTLGLIKRQRWIGPHARRQGRPP